MNALRGIIHSIEVRNRLSLVRVRVGDSMLTSIVIDTPESATYLRENNCVRVIFKETEVIIGKGTEHAISMQNKMPGTVEQIESGDLLSKLRIRTSGGLITSIITSNAVRQLQLEAGMLVTALVKTNEMMLAEC